LSTAIRTAFGTTKEIATYMVDKFVTEIEEYGRVGIWNERCEITVEWEKSVGITTVSKRAQGSTRVEGHESSSRVFTDSFQRQRSTLDVKEIHGVADSRVLEAYQGRTRLHMMERRGGGGLFIKAMDIG
jgi:hypothetical protein